MDNDFFSQVKTFAAQKLLICLLGFCVLGLLGCIPSDFPDHEMVSAAFSAEHPTYTVLSVGLGEGDFSSAYFHIRYRKPGDQAVHEDVWQYLEAGEEWRLTHKETIQ